MSEGLYAPEEKGYELPEEGTVQGVCADLIDLGIVSTQYGPKRKIQFVFQIEQESSDGKRMQIRSAPLALKSGDKASLQKFIVDWRGGKRFTQESPLSKLDLTTLVGQPALLSIIHNTSSQGGVFANIGTISQLPKGVPAMKVEGYVRRVKKEKDASQSGNTAAARVGKGEALPF